MNSIFIMANCVRTRIADSDARALRADGVRSGDEDQDRFGYRARCDGFWRRSPGQDRDQVPGTRFREDPGESSGASCKDRPDRCLCASARLIALDRDERHGWGSRYPESRGRCTRQWLKIKKGFEAHSIYSIGTFAISPDEIVTRRDSMGLHRCRLSRARVRVIGGNKMP